MKVRYCLQLNRKSVFTTKKHLKDEIIHKLQGEIIDKHANYAIYIGKGKYVYDKYGIYMNQIDPANVKIIDDLIIAIRDIEEGEEISYQNMNF